MVATPTSGWWYVSVQQAPWVENSVYTLTIPPIMLHTCKYMFLLLGFKPFIFYCKFQIWPWAWHWLFAIMVIALSRLSVPPSPDPLWREKKHFWCYDGENWTFWTVFLFWFNCKIVFSGRIATDCLLKWTRVFHITLLIPVFQCSSTFCWRYQAHADSIPIIFITIWLYSLPVDHLGHLLISSIFCPIILLVINTCQLSFSTLSSAHYSVGALSCVCCLGMVFSLLDSSNFALLYDEFQIWSRQWPFYHYGHCLTQIIHSYIVSHLHYVVGLYSCTFFAYTQMYGSVTYILGRWMSTKVQGDNDKGMPQYWQMTGNGCSRSF